MRILKRGIMISAEHLVADYTSVSELAYFIESLLEIQPLGFKMYSKDHLWYSIFYV